MPTLYNSVTVSIRLDILSHVNCCYYPTVTIESVIVKIIYMLVFHVLYAMTLWSYYQTIFTEAGRVPREVSNMIFQLNHRLSDMTVLVHCGRH